MGSGDRERQGREEGETEREEGEVQGLQCDMYQCPMMNILSMYRKHTLTRKCLTYYKGNFDT